MKSVVGKEIAVFFADWNWKNKIIKKELKFKESDGLDENLAKSISRKLLEIKEFKGG